MKTLTLTKEQKSDHIEIPVDFIDTQMPQASGEALKVWFYLCRAALDSSIILSVNDMADLFDVSPKRILQALSYWEERGLLALSYSGDELSEIRLVSESPAQAAPYEAPAEVRPVKAQDNIRLVKTSVPETVPEPEAANEADVLDPSVLDRDAEFSELLGLSEYYLKHPLNSSQRNSLGVCYLMFSRKSDIIEYLLEYCIERGRTSFHYIESVARGWKEAGYQTLTEIKAGTALRNKTVYSIMNAFGLGNRAPVREESEYIRKWTADFDLPVILAACERTMGNIHAPSFRYADSILSSWKESGVRTERDIEAADRDYRGQKSAEGGRSAKSGKQNSFRNFNERDTDYDSVINGYLNN